MVYSHAFNSYYFFFRTHGSSFSLSFELPNSGLLLVSHIVNENESSVRSTAIQLNSCSMSTFTTYDMY